MHKKALIYHCLLVRIYRAFVNFVFYHYLTFNRQISERAA